LVDAAFAGENVGVETEFWGQKLRVQAEVYFKNRVILVFFERILMWNWSFLVWEKMGSGRALSEVFSFGGDVAGVVC
jgi:hypothetical protein